MLTDVLTDTQLRYSLLSGGCSQSLVGSGRSEILKFVQKDQVMPPGVEPQLFRRHGFRLRLQNTL